MKNLPAQSQPESSAAVPATTLAMHIAPALAHSPCADSSLCRFSSCILSQACTAWRTTGASSRPACALIFPAMRLASCASGSIAGRRGPGDPTDLRDKDARLGEVAVRVGVIRRLAAVSGLANPGLPPSRIAAGRSDGALCGVAVGVAASTACTTRHMVRSACLHSDAACTEGRYRYCAPDWVCTPTNLPGIASSSLVLKSKSSTWAGELGESSLGL